MRREAGSHLKDPDSIFRKARPPRQPRAPVGDGLPVTFAHASQAPYSQGLTGQCLPLARGCLTGNSAQALIFLLDTSLGSVHPSRTSVQMRQASLRKSALATAGPVHSHAP